ERLFGEAPAGLPGDEGGAKSLAGTPSGPREEAIQALEALGYRTAEAEKLVRAVAADDMDSQAIIRAALKASLK
ncbi:MAG: Holliday junction branch migration protein RuvA, partial [Gammaproteobacteria bacterium]